MGRISMLPVVGSNFLSEMGFLGSELRFCFSQGKLGAQKMVLLRSVGIVLTRMMVDELTLAPKLQRRRTADAVRR